MENEDLSSPQHAPEQRRETLRRRRRASTVELSIYFGIFVLFVLRNAFLGNISDRFYSRDILVIQAFLSPEVIIAAGWLFFAMFFQILTGATPLVALIVTGNVFRFGYSVSSVSEALASTVSELAKERSIETERASEIALHASTDEIEANFFIYIKRSQDAAKIAQRRPNALLFVGTIVSVVGLVFFVATLPGSHLSLTAEASPPPNFVDAFLSILPRLLMLAFIQLLAGFFLRQYRSSMEDFRYYEAILRNREAQFLSYALTKRMDDKKLMSEFIRNLLREQQFGVLLPGTTTTSLEAQRNEHNEFSTLYERLAEMFAQARPQSKSADGSAKPD